MRTTSYLALSRQAALERQMATIANNLANATTTGYRAEHMVFEETLHRAGRQRVAFVQDVGLARDLSPGPIAQTGNPLDLAIEGAGYLAFATDGRDAATAGPAASRSPRTAGWSTPTGRPLLDDGGNAILLAADETAISIAGDGTVSGGNGPIARIGVVWLRQRAGACAAPATGCSPRPSRRPRPSGARVVQGALEGSNVQPVLEMTTMLASVRAFEGAQRLLDTEHELERQAIERAVRAAG